MKQLANFYGLFMNLLAACFMLPLITALIHREDSSVRAFSLVVIVCIIIAAIIKRAFGSDIEALKLRPRHTYFLVATVWLIASLIGCLPYIISGSIPNFFNAFFETASGFTTTGATIIDDIESMPRSILLWRSLTQWLGGMGIIVLFVAFLPSFGIKARNIAMAETPGPTVTKVSTSFSGTAQRLYIVYIVLTLAQVILLMGGGFSLYDAVNHSFTTMATGGFSTYNDSIAHFDSDYIVWVITVFMFLAGTNFELYFFIIRGDIKHVFKNEEFRLYLIILALAISGISISLLTSYGYSSIYEAVRDSSFQVITLVSTTGYATVDFDLWPTFCLMIIVILMVIGSCSSSTAGGIKVIRLLTLGKMIRREIVLKLHGRAVSDVTVDRRKLSPDTLSFIIGFLTMYFFTILAGTLLISLFGQGDLITNFTATLSCISNVGPGLSDVGPTCTYRFYNSFSKFVLSMVMIGGRLELSTLFVLFSTYFWRPNRA